MIDNSATDTVVRAFVQVIAAAWQHASSAAQVSASPSFMNDWLQANWEMLVEAGLPAGTYLEVYGEGADINPRSSRVSSPGATATAAVVLKAPPGVSRVIERLSGVEMEIPGGRFALEEFVALEGTWYTRREPFDCALVETEDGPLLFRVEDVTFELGAPSRG